MILSVDVQYVGEFGIAAGVLFEQWSSQKVTGEFSCVLKGVGDYIPGEFFRRELPCILRLITESNLPPSVIIVDGYVYLDGATMPGLGKYLYDALEGRVPVVGIAKNRFRGISESYEVYRGRSVKPLYVTSAGMDVELAKSNVVAMHGDYRMPSLIKRADQICRLKAAEFC